MHDEMAGVAKKAFNEIMKRKTDWADDGVIEMACQPSDRGSKNRRASIVCRREWEAGEKRSGSGERPRLKLSRGNDILAA